MNLIDQDLVELSAINLTFPKPDQRKIAGLFSISLDDLFVPVDPGRLQKAKRWRFSSTKRILERTAATLVWNLALKSVAGKAIEDLHGKPPPKDAIISLAVGFLGLGTPQYHVDKVRTVVPGAESSNGSPFDTPAFPKKSGFVPDTRILPGADKLRGSRKDEVLQVRQIANGERLNLVGIRGYSCMELSGIEKLIGLRSHPDLKFSQAEQDLLGSYPSVIARAVPLQALFSPLSFTESKNTPITARLIMDLKYLEYANPRVDLLMVLGSLPQIFRRVGAR